MPWRYANLRGSRVLARCDGAGELVASGGRVEIRYSPEARKAYHAGARNLVVADDEPVLPDETCPALDGEGTGSRTKSGGAGARKKRAAAGTPGGAVTIPENAVIAYTDGACSGNPGPAGLGVVICEDGEQRECCQYLGEATNNVAELSAIGVAADAVTDPTRPVRIYTDSRYSIGVLTMGWKAKANQSLIADLKQRLARLSDVQLIYVKGHAGIELNERADQLAVAAVQSRASSPWQRVSGSSGGPGA